MTKRIGLWIDHKKAVMVIPGEREVEVKTIESGLERHVRYHGATRRKTPYSAQYKQGDDQIDKKYLEHLKKTREEFENEMRPEAEKRVRIGLLLSEVVREQKFEVSEKEVNDEIEIALGYAPDEKKEEARKYYDSEEGRRAVENSLLTRKAMEWMMGEAEVD